MKKTLLSSVAFIALMGYAQAAGTIKPTCWEENVNGSVQRHCEVIRPGTRDDAKTPQPRPPAGPPRQAAMPPLATPNGPPVPPHQPFYGRYVGPQSMPPNFGYGGPGIPLYDFVGPAPGPAPIAPASPYQSCVTASYDGFVEVKDNPNEWGFNIQVLPNGVPLGVATYGYQVPYVPGGEVWVWVQLAGGLQGWSRLGSLSCGG